VQTPRPDRLSDVAIVGLGPVGALLANLLGQAGLTVDVHERDREIHALPRAVHFDGEIMRIFQAADLAEEVARCARASPYGARYIDPSGRVLVERRGIEGEGPQGWAGSWYFHQPDLDRTLRAGLERFPNVSVRLESEIATPEDLPARFVVGCDGARSVVRRAIGGRQRDLGLHQPWLVVDLLCDPARPRVAALPPYSVQFCDPSRPMTLVNVGPSGAIVRRRWEIMLMPGDDPDRIAEPERFWPMIARWLAPEDGHIERAAVYTFHSVVQEGWRRGRLLLAGDSCHQTPPFLGQGLCAGLRDVANLAWKLAAIVRDGAPDSLLDTYESERRPHVATFIELAVRMGGVIQATDPAAVAARDRRFAGGPESFSFPLPQLGAGCRVDDPSPIGTIAPQPRLPDGRRMDDTIGARFAVLGARDVLAGLDAPAAILPDVGLDWLATHGSRAAILRPDRYVYAMARTRAELDAALARLARDLRPA